MAEIKYCNIAKKCNGCQLSNLEYSDQVKLKQHKLSRTLGRMVKANRIKEAASPLHYRNKAQWVFKKMKGRTVCGIYQSADKGIAVTPCCPLHTESANEIALTLCRLFDKFSLEPYDFKRRKGFVRSAVIREGFLSGEILVNIVASKNTFPKEKEFAVALAKKHPDIKTIVISESQSAKLTTGGNPRNILGNGYITDTLCGLDFLIGYDTFFQINPIQTEVLYSTAIKMADIKPTDTVLDTYCGIGTITLAVADKCKKVIGVELNENSIENARKNAELNGIENAEFFANDVKKQIRTLLSKGEKFDLCIVDPPRSGCDIEFLKSLVDAEIPQILYISCNIETQARDARFLIKNGYKMKKQQGVDMFPYTSHIESIALFKKSDSVQTISENE